MRTLLFNRFKDLFRIDIAVLPENGIEALPKTLLGFIWFFARQIKRTLGVALLIECVFAILLSVTLWYVGVFVKQEAYTAAFLLGGLFLLLARVAVHTPLSFVYQLLLLPYFGNLIRRQLYWYTSRQSLGFFNDEFAGRIANKIMQTGYSIRDFVYSIIGAVWFVGIFVLSNLVLILSENAWLTLPTLIWLMICVLSLVLFLPHIHRRSKITGESASTLTGQVVDGFTNILPTQFFARRYHEDKRMLGYLHTHAENYKSVTAYVVGLKFAFEMANFALLLGTAWIGLHLIETQGQAGIAAFAMGITMALNMTNQSYWIMETCILAFDNIGRIQEGMETLSAPHTVKDAPEAQPLVLPEASPPDVYFDSVTFHYGSAETKLMTNLSLRIPAGQKLGIVGKSGAGKSTITGLLMRAYDPESGHIAINGQPIAEVTQDSLRRAIAIVTQDSYLFHRSIRENIAYGKPDATEEDIIDAAKRAHAYDFIQTQEDGQGRTGLDAYVGERGVKLSGGQKQRISIARTLLKNAPILVLDEATSALDSESESTIQAALSPLMDGKTVIAIAHRLSTLKQMERILVMDEGRIIEDGTHESLMANPDSHYGKLWAMQGI